MSMAAYREVLIIFSERSCKIIYGSTSWRSGEVEPLFALPHANSYIHSALAQLFTDEL